MNSDAGGELDPHGAENLGNPVSAQKGGEDNIGTTRLIFAPASLCPGRRQRHLQRLWTRRVLRGVDVVCFVRSVLHCEAGEINFSQKPSTCAELLTSFVFPAAHLHRRVWSRIRRPSMRARARHHGMPREVALISLRRSSLSFADFGLFSLWQFVMPGAYLSNSFISCDGEAAQPPGFYPQPDGSVSTL